ncbi:MAG TPA: hypothetical protein VH025_05750 [Solirubrobacteraceae bacterium]|nr:hypothetical protein [Solirubrobacteraceae bacterium]
MRRRATMLLAAALVIGCLCSAAAGTSVAGASATAGASVSPVQLASSASALAAPLRRAALAGGTESGKSFTRGGDPNAPIPVATSDVPPAGRRLSSRQVIQIAARLPKIKALKREHPGVYPGAYLKGALRWQVSYFSRGQGKELAQIIVADLTGRVLEQWTGFQVAWTMARGYPGAFGRHSNSLYVWLPMCLLFLIPFVDFRRLRSLLHLDLLVLLSFSVSLAFFNHAHIYASVPLSYPPLLYLLIRMLALLRRRPGAREAPRLRLLVPASWLAIGVVFLLGFRIALNVTDSNVIDVGYAGVIGASRVAGGKALYGSYPSDNEHGDTYGPVNYEAYVPFQQAFGWSGTWDDLPAAHAAAIFFDLLAVALLFLIGRRMRGPTLGIALAYGWVSYPFTLFALECNSNDTLVGALVLAALLAASYNGRIARGGRGALAALAGLTKFAPLALAPLLATHGLNARVATSPGARVRQSASALGLFALGFLVVGALVSIPAFSHDSLDEIYKRTLAYQGDRASPFSIWGLYGWRGPEVAVELAAVALAVVLALVPRRADLVGLAAACAAVTIAVQLGVEHWFYLYIPWFFGALLVALLGSLSPPRSLEPDAASEAARWSRPSVALSS